MTFKWVLAADGLWNGEMKQVVVAGQKILLVRLDNTIHAYEDRCAHKAMALSEGTLAGHVLTCPAHHWQYDVRSGHGLNPQTARLKTVAVRLGADGIFVDAEGSQ